MLPTSAEIRARARQSLRGNWGLAIGTLVLFYIASFALGLFNLIPFAGWIVGFVLAGPLALGLNMFFVKLARLNSPSVGDAFEGFGRFVPAFVLYLLVGIFTFLWSLLFIIPGIIASFRYSQAFYIMQDNPNMDALEAINRSKQMMVGHKWRLFVLYLSFIGWWILGALTFGIGYLWIAPYVLTSAAHFYDDLKDRVAVPPPPPPGFTVS
ncbi:DUF975 family protein [Cohnella faecalis]|uniref:DUF975 family protein n=1 Tax=Cohnella faecalis TaxID=2315694 RepID=A0A398CEF2_9BACL|nr:DUF975 family protein [Cohnella faecalis]RIE01083.1 DUF975 family protein [Cohnella faecalis]